MFYDESELVSGYADFQRAGMSIGVGNIVQGKKYSKIQQILRSQALTPREKFLEAVKLFCVTEDLGFSDLYERIADRHPHPQYLSPKGCAFAINYMIKPDGGINKSALTTPANLDRFSISALDAYRYAVLISELLRA